MTGLVDWAVTRSRMILAMVILAIGAGVYAYLTLPKEGSPNIDVPILYVSVPLPGVSAADSERLMVKPLETKLRSLEGLDQMTAFATENHAGILLQFDFGWDKAGTIADVRDKVDQAKSEMPDEIEEPNVIEINLSAFPILVISLSGDVPERTLLKLAKEMQPAGCRRSRRYRPAECGPRSSHPPRPRPGRPPQPPPVGAGSGECRHPRHR